MDFGDPADHRVKLKESEKKHRYFDNDRELKKKQTVRHESDIICKWCSWYCHQRIDTRIGGMGNKKDEWKPSKLQHFRHRPKY